MIRRLVEVLNHELDHDHDHVALFIASDSPPAASRRRARHDAATTTIAEGRWSKPSIRSESVSAVERLGILDKQPRVGLSKS